MANIPILSVRVAPLSGKISWATYQSITVKLNGTSYIFTIQTTRWFAIAEVYLYKPWRIVMRKQYQWVGHVVAEFEKQLDAINSLIEIKQLFDAEFEKFINKISDLKHGDVISVPTKLIPGGGLRHFGIYDHENNQVIEYQPDKLASWKGRIQATPFDEFCKRVKGEYDGKLDLRKHKYMKHDVFPENEVVVRARKQIKQCGYNAIFKNCETFALWCKLGNAQSIQSRQFMTVILDATLKVGAFLAVVVVVAGITYFVSLNTISLVSPTAANTLTTNNGLQVAVDANNYNVEVVGTANCPYADGCKTAMGAGGGAMGLGVAPVALFALQTLQRICDDRNRFTVQEQKLQLLDDDMKMDVDERKINIIKEGSVYIQYGLNSSIQICWITVTEKYLVIEDRNNCNCVNSENTLSTTIYIDWTKLLNIDDLNGNNGGHSLQLLFKHELFPSIYIYGGSKSEKIKWLGIFKKMCSSVILTKELQSVKSYAAELGFTQCQIESALTKYHRHHGTVYNINVFIGAITSDEEENQNYEV